MRDVLRPGRYPVSGRHRAGHDAVILDQAVGGAHGMTIDWDADVLTGGSDAGKDESATAIRPGWRP
jgi:hypothetical protein